MSLFNVNKVHEFVAHNTVVNCMTFGTLSHQVMATGGEDFNVNIWRVGNAANIWSLGQNKSPIECLCFDSEEQCIVSGAMNGSLKVFDLNEGRLARNLRGHQVNINSINYHPYGEFIASGSVDTTMKVWDVRNKTCIQTYTGHEKEVTCVRFSPDGRWVASSSKDGQLLIWDLIAGKLLQTIKIGPAHLTSFEFNPAEFLLAAVTSNRTVRLWDMENFSCIGTTSNEATPIRALSFTKDGAALCTASADTLRVVGWDPVQSRGSVGVAWDRISDIKVTDDNTVLCGSIISNFVSVWTVGIQNVLSRPPEQAYIPAAEDKSPSRLPPSGKVPSRTVRASPEIKMDRKITEYVEEKTSGLVIDDNYLTAADKNPPPAVSWESGLNAKDMAATLGESFDARMRQKQYSHDAPGNAEPKSEELNGRKRDVVSVANDALEKMLPPSAFGQKAVPASVVTNTSSIAPNRRAPPAIPVDDPARQHSIPNNDFNGSPQLSVVGSSHAKRRPVTSAAPLDIRDDKFKVGIPTYESIHEEYCSERSDDKFNNLIIRDGKITSGILNQRLSSLSLLRRHWEKGEMGDIISHLSTLQVLSHQDPKNLLAVSDFLNAIELRGHGMNLEYCTKMMPVLESMLDGGLEALLTSSLRSITTLCEVFGELIRQTRSVLVAGGVDISREDRLNKCNSCHVVLMRVRSRLDAIRLSYRKSAKVLGLLEKLQNLLDDIA